MKDIGKSSGIDDEVVQDQRQRDDNDLQDERQDSNQGKNVNQEKQKGKEQRNRLDPICFFNGRKELFLSKIGNFLGWAHRKKPLKATIDSMTNMIVTTSVNVTGAPVTDTVANNAEKPKKFNGHNFKRWQQKMFLYLRTLNLARFLNEIAPQVEPPKKGQPFNTHAMQAVKAWKHLEFWCHN
ncbi:hypothetical protein Tco_0104022 [Tanacetum coccineum]